MYTVGILNEMPCIVAMAVENERRLMLTCSSELASPIACLASWVAWLVEQAARVIVLPLCERHDDDIEPRHSMLATLDG